jgi:hypothetical protein
MASVQPKLPVAVQGPGLLLLLLLLLQTKGAS